MLQRQRQRARAHYDDADDDDHDLAVIDSLWEQPQLVTTGIVNATLLGPGNISPLPFFGCI